MTLIRLSSAPRRTLLLGTTGLGLLFATPAMAQCVPDGATFTCAGENSAPIVINTGAPVVVTTEPGFSVTAGGGEAAFDIRSNGSVTYTDTTGATVRGTTARGLLIVGGSGGSGAVTVNSNGTFTGETLGVQINSLGSGGIDARFSGAVTGIGSFGIGLLNAPGSNVPGVPNDTVLVASGPVSGTNGIVVQARGASGSINITATGTVTATSATGNAISVQHSVAGVGGDISVTTNDVVSAGTGVNIANNGRGATTIQVNGSVNTAAGSGVGGVNGATATSLSIVTTGAVDGGRTGIAAINNGSGDTSVTSGGQVTSHNLTPAVSNGVPSGNGISLFNGSSAGSATVAAAGVDGGRGGIFVVNNGRSSTSVTATGTVRARDGIGIEVVTGVSTTDTIVNSAEVTATGDAINIAHNGTGALSVTATGALNSDTGDGMSVGAGAGAGDMSVDIVDATGGRFGLAAAYSGDGNARVTSTGTVVGATSAVRLESAANTGTMTGDIRNATGTEFGISAQTLGIGGLTLITRGTVEGGIAGVDIVSDNGATWSLTNSGTIRNGTGASSALALRSQGGSGTITNSGMLLGTVSLGAVDDGGSSSQNEEQAARSARIGIDAAIDSHAFANSGQWNSIGGTSEFLGVADVLLNQQGGRLIGGINAGLAETTIYSGLETLTNNGIISMRDGGVGDVIRTSGDAFFSAGSILEVDAGGTGSDRFVATGATQIAPGALLQVSNPQTLVLGTRYTILESAGGVTGQFTFTNQLISTFVGYRQGVTETSVFVELAQLRAFVDAGITPNQRSVAAVLDTLPASNSLSAAILLLPSDAAAQNAFDALSGEIHPGVRTAIVEDSRLPRNAVLGRLDDRRGGAVWGQVIGNWGESDGRNGTATLKRDGYGALLGGDVRIGDTLTIGVAGAYLERDLDLPARSSRGTLKSTHVLGYAGASLGGVQLKVGGGYATASVETVRDVAFPGIDQTLAADYDGTLIQGFAEAGYRLPLAGGHVEPFAQIATMRVESDGFTETGGSAALGGAKARDTATISTAGVRFETARAGIFSIGGTAGWQHSFGTLTPQTDFRLPAGTGFTVLGAPRSRDGAVATVDAKFRLSPGVTLAVSYDGLLGSDSADHSVIGGLRIAF